MAPTPQLRPATPADVPALRALIAASVRGLSPGFYADAQIESALEHMFGVDSQLIADGTYYVLEAGSTLVAAGGWSARRTLYGGDPWEEGGGPPPDPQTVRGGSPTPTSRDVAG